jgi:hypothetical protein
MTPAEIDWKDYESAVVEVAQRCLRQLVDQPLAEAICSFGIEGQIEEGWVSVSANTVSHRTSDNRWWIPDWSHPYLDEDLPDETTQIRFRSFSEQFHSIDYGEDSTEVYRALCGHFRLACLTALKQIGTRIDEFEFPRSDDFAMVYMDDGEELYRGLGEIESGINAQLKNEG